MKSGSRFFGAEVLADGRVCFRLWAPRAQRVDLRLCDHSSECMISMSALEKGWFQRVTKLAGNGSRYEFCIDGERRVPDPASRYQPEGVHGPSQVICSEFIWDDDDWRGISLEDYVIYELHVGTFTREGTFEAICPYLEYLKTLGVTALEIMPVGQFPGNRNWGYDGVYPFAVQNSYGGPEGLKKFVNACHRAGLAVILDVVYNHLGPEGNYLEELGPYFTSKYRSPWGKAVNFDGPDSDTVRRFFLENALYWIREFHFDALRVDAIHGIYDSSAIPFLSELAKVVQEQDDVLNRRIYAIAESDLNDVKVIRSRENGGYGYDAQWCDDFHHALHALLTGENSGYYQDFGKLENLAKAYRDGFVYTGQYSHYRRCHHGNETKGFSTKSFVVFSQNHDQVGNRMKGERLSRLISFEALKLAAAVVLLSPYIPLLFMGEEYGETAPFPYFISHSDPQLIAAVREGRESDFRAFSWKGQPPDPQDKLTFKSAILNHSLKKEKKHRALLQFYRELLFLRQKIFNLERMDREDLETQTQNHFKILIIRPNRSENSPYLFFHFEPAHNVLNWDVPRGNWERILDSSEKKWAGPGGSSSKYLSGNKIHRLRLSPWSASLWVKSETR